MQRSMNVAALFSAAVLCGAVLGASSRPAPAWADQERAPTATRASQAAEPYDPKKKNPGDPCKSADECQPHHSCVKVGDKNVCQAPPRPRLPPGAVT